MVWSLASFLCCAKPKKEEVKAEANAADSPKYEPLVNNESASQLAVAQLPMAGTTAPSAETLGVPGNGMWCTFCVMSILTLGILPLSVIIIWITCSQAFQVWALKQPDSVVVRILYPFLIFLESLGFGGGVRPVIPSWKKFFDKYGKNFCATGQVWLGSWEDVSKAVAGPQARTHRFGEHPLLAKKLPSQSRCVFLLSLSNRGAGGYGLHEAIRKCLDDYLFKRKEVEERKTDPYAERLFAGIVVEYMTSAHSSRSDPFFSDDTIGLKRFLTKYLFYVIFGVKEETSSEEHAKALMKLFQNEHGLMHWFWPLGKPDATAECERVSDVIAGCPALANFRESPDFFNLTKKEVSDLMCAIMRFFGVQGTNVMSQTIMTAWTDVWDSLDLNNDLEIERFIHECGRLSGPVTASARVATEDFSCDIAGSTHTFPKGTNIAIPLCMACIDKDFWGPDAEQFNQNRPKLLENSLLFNSVGTTGLRECPGKAISMYTMKQLLQRCGKARRGMPVQQPEQINPQEESFVAQPMQQAQEMSAQPDSFLALASPADAQPVMGGGAVDSSVTAASPLTPLTPGEPFANPRDSMIVTGPPAEAADAGQVASTVNEHDAGGETPKDNPTSEAPETNANSAAGTADGKNATTAAGSAPEAPNAQSTADTPGAVGTASTGNKPSAATEAVEIENL